MSNRIKKDLFWGTLLGLFVFLPCWLVLLDHRGYETPEEFKEIIPTSQTPSSTARKMIWMRTPLLMNG